MRLIDTDALKKKLQYVYSCEYIGSKSKEGIVSDIIDAIDNAPTVEERPKGEWIKKDEPFGGFGDTVLTITCSLCDFGFIYHGECLNYCPQCGAEMKEADNDLDT